MDSDSDGSYISATPPRDPSPPPPPPPPTQPPRSTRQVSIKSRAKTRAAATSTSRTILKPKPSRKKQSEKAQVANSDIPLQENPIPSPDLSNLPFKIHCLTQRNFSFSSCNTSTTAETIRPGGLCASKFPSFTKISKDNLRFEDVESASSEPSLSSSQLNYDVGCNNQVLEGTGKDGFSSAKVVKRLPNLIGAFNVHASSSSLPVKKAKCVAEGNFVKLNINGYGRKRFTTKGKRNKFGNSSSGGRRFRKRSKAKQGVGEKGEEEGVELVNEDGLIFEAKQRDQRLAFDMGPIEEAVMRIRNEVSTENLISLLKLTHGYDSFRDGQLEAIKMVLSRKSTMLILPTGAGKSLCYQLPAIVLPGITLVVSPLVALMIDQLKNLPPAISGGLLSSSQVSCYSCQKFLLVFAFRYLLIACYSFTIIDTRGDFCHIEDVAGWSN